MLKKKNEGLVNLSELEPYTEYVVDGKDSIFIKKIESPKVSAEFGENTCTLQLVGQKVRYLFSGGSNFLFCIDESRHVIYKKHDYELANKYKKTIKDDFTLKSNYYKAKYNCMTLNDLGAYCGMHDVICGLHDAMNEGFRRVDIYDMYERWYKRIVEAISLAAKPVKASCFKKFFKKDNGAQHQLTLTFNPNNAEELADLYLLLESFNTMELPGSSTMTIEELVLTAAKKCRRKFQFNLNKLTDADIGSTFMSVDETSKEKKFYLYLGQYYSYDVKVEDCTDSCNCILCKGSTRLIKKNIFWQYDGVVNFNEPYKQYLFIAEKESEKCEYIDEKTLEKKRLLNCGYNISDYLSICSSKSNIQKDIKASTMKRFFLEKAALYQKMKLKTRFDYTKQYLIIENRAKDKAFKTDILHYLSIPYSSTESLLDYDAYFADGESLASILNHPEFNFMENLEESEQTVE